jgi:hypothetical protein
LEENTSMDIEEKNKKIKENQNSIKFIEKYIHNKEEDRLRAEAEDEFEMLMTETEFIEIYKPKFEILFDGNKPKSNIYLQGETGLEKYFEERNIFDEIEEKFNKNGPNHEQSSNIENENIFDNITNDLSEKLKSKENQRNNKL